MPCAAATHRCFRRAMAQIAPAVRQYAQHGVVEAVTLESCAKRPADRGGRGDAVTPVAGWIPVARWNGDVIERILRQADATEPLATVIARAAIAKLAVIGATSRAESAAITPASPDEPVATAPPAPLRAVPPDARSAAQPAPSRTRRVWHKSQRRPVLATALLLAAAWLVLALLQIGGDPRGLFGSSAASQPWNRELPVEAPLPSAAAGKASAGRHPDGRLGDAHRTRPAATLPALRQP